MERIGFVMALRPGAEAEYRRRHSAVWPEMIDELRAAGAGTYSIFLSGDQLFGYLEVADFDRFRRHMAASEVNERWQADMAGLIDPLTDPETGFHRRLDEVFRLEPIGPAADSPDVPASDASGRLGPSQTKHP